MIYTCYEMIGDCRAHRPEGWVYFIANYVPVVRRVLDHYCAGRASDALLRRVLSALAAPASPLFASLAPVPERVFVSELRQQVLAAASADDSAPAVAIDLSTLQEALAPLTATEKQAVWLETMRYGAAHAARMLRMDAATLQKVREKAAGLVRSKVDSWSRTVLEDNGCTLGREAAPAGKDCLPAKAFLDVIDGRATWSAREAMEAHWNGCLHCIDHFCRMLEAVDLMRDIQKLSETEAAPYRELLGVKAIPKPPAWKRLLGAG